MIATDEGEPEFEFEQGLLNREQDEIEVRQVRNIAKMVRQGTNAQRIKEEEPFLEYAFDRYNIRVEDEADAQQQ